MLENLLKRELIVPDLSAPTKTAVIQELARLVSFVYTGLEASVIADALTEREALGSTGIEMGIAIPHAKIDGIDGIIIAIGRSRNGVDFQSQDGVLTRLFFVLLAPLNMSGEHLKVLARLVKILGLPGIKARLLEAKDAGEIYNILIEADK